MAWRARFAERRTWRNDRGSQLVEFALVLPILCLLLVGAWDFGSAFAMKQKLTNAAREGGRIVVSNTTLPTTSCAPGTNPPCSISAAATAVGQYLNNAGLSGSCLSSANATGSFPVWTWSCSSITLSINRGVNAGVDTTVTLTYPVTWSLRNFFGVTVIPNQITTHVTMQNLTL